MLCGVSGALVVFKLLLLWSHPLVRGGVGQDMVDLYAGALAVRHGLNPYTASVALGQHLTGIPPALHPFPYVHPPAVTLLALPFTWVSPAVAYRFLSIADVLAAALAAMLVLVAVRMPARLTWIAGGLALASGAGFLAAWNGQLTPLLALAIVAAYGLALRGHYAWAGALSTVLLVKPHLYILAFMVIVLVGNRGWRIGALLGTLAFLVAGWFATGAAGYLSFVRATLRDAHGPERLHDTDSLGVDSVVYHLFHEPMATLILAGLVVVLLSVGALLLGIVRKDTAPFHRRQVALAALLLLDSLLFPYSHQYDSSLLLLPYILAAISLPGGRTRRCCLWLAGTAALAPYLNLFPAYTGVRPLPLIDLLMVALLSVHCLLSARRVSPGAVDGADAAAWGRGRPWLPLPEATAPSRTAA